MTVLRVSSLSEKWELRFVTSAEPRMKRHVSTQAPLFGTERVSTRFLHDNDTIGSVTLAAQHTPLSNLSLMLLNKALTIERL